MLTGRYFGDATVMRVAHTCEQALLTPVRALRSRALFDTKAAKGAAGHITGVVLPVLGLGYRKGYDNSLQTRQNRRR